MTYPRTEAYTLSRDTSDHIPCVLSIATTIPKPRIFRFENHWMEHEDFMKVVKNAWDIPVLQQDPAKKIMAKFKNLRRILRDWQAQCTKLAATIANVKLLIAFFDVIEEHRDLTVEEWNFRDTIKDKLASLLHGRKIYWKQRSTIKWVKVGDATIEFIHARSTINDKRNSIQFLQDSNGNTICDHAEKATLIWEAYKERIATSDYTTMHFDLQALLQPGEDLGGLDEPFSKEEIDRVVADLPHWFY